MKSVFAPTRVRVPLTDDYGEEVARYAARAEAGDIDAAMALANSTNVRGGTSRLYPPGIPDDRLHWLRIAAERGNLEAMCRYAIDVKTLRNWHPGEAIHRLDPKWLGEVEQNARRFLAIALSNEVPDAFPIAHSAHRDGLLGLPQDPAAAHACLLVFAQLFDDDIPRRLVEGHAARLKPAELHEAQRRAAAGAGCLIPG